MTGPDVIVVGGGIGGCMVAIGAAASASRVLLVEPRAYLGHEMTATLRLWLGPRGEERLPVDLRDILFPVGEEPEIDIARETLPGGLRELALFRGSVKKGLFSAVRGSGVEVLLMTDVAGLLLGGGEVAGVVLANRLGLQTARAPLVIDATERGNVWRPGFGVRPVIPRHGRYVIGFSGVTPSNGELITPPELGVPGDLLRLHPGKSTACSLLVEYAVPCAPSTESCLTLHPPELRARLLAIAISSYLTRSVPAFRLARLAAIAHEIGWQAESPASVPTGVGPVGLEVLAGAFPLDPSCDDLLAFASSCRQMGRSASREARGTSAPAANELAFGTARVPIGACQQEPMGDPGLSFPLQQVSFPTDVLPDETGVDVIVAGGGTAGANAAIATAERGARTMVVEANSDLGGTQTLGLVSGYYYGFRGGITARVDAAVSALDARLHGGKQRSRRVAKMLYYLSRLAELGGEVHTNTVAVGVTKKGPRVTGLVVCGAHGLRAVPAAVVIDATGDGDVAALAGVPFTFGDPRTGNVQDYSQWSMGKTGGPTRTPDLDVIDQCKLSEVMRGLAIAHARGTYFDFASMLTVREGRHIAGEYTLSLIDVFEGRSHDDAVAVACTDWDPHGTSSSWLGRLGFLPVHTQQLPLQIPLRCCIPKGLTGLLVTAKAISATADAACLARMATDIQNLGYATGVAAAMTVALNGDPRRIPTAELRLQLDALGLVPPEHTAGIPDRGSPDERVHRLASGDDSALLDVALLSADQAVTPLRRAFDTATADRLGLAKGLAWFGMADGVGLLAESLLRLSLHEPERYPDVHPHKEGNPRAGIVDELDDYWRINQLLTLIGLTGGGEDAVRAVKEAIDRTWAGGGPKRDSSPYISGRIDMQRVPHFDRLLCIAFAVERLADPVLAGPMDMLLKREHIAGNVTASDEDAGARYHSALAEVSLASGAARCGSVNGARRLVGFLRDVHGIISTFAHGELCHVTGQDFGRDADRWEQWLADRTELNPVPYHASAAVY